MRTAGEDALVKALGVRQLAAAIVNATVGAGIFVLPALVYQELRGAAPLAFVICAGAMALIVTTYAVAGSRVSLTGGVYAYAEVAFGTYVGFLAGVLQWVVFLLGVAGVATAILDQLSALLPFFADIVARLVTLGAMLAALAAINVRGVTSGARTIEVLTAVKLLTLLAFVGAGVFFVDVSSLAWPGLPAVDVLGRTVLLLIFAFVGIEVALTPSGEVRDPARTVPRAIYLALAITASLYLAVQLVAQGVLGAELAQHTQTPIADAGGRFLGATGRLLILIGTLCSMFGYVSGDMLSGPRNLYALARDGFIPAVFARLHPVRRTPHIAIWTHAVFVFVLASTSTFEYLIVVSNVGMLLLYLLCAAASVELVRRDVRIDGTPFMIPGARWAPYAAAVVIVWILSTATWQEFAFTSAVIGIAAGIYALRNTGGSTRQDPPYGA